MCGIAGIVRLRDGGLPPDRAALQRMVGSLTHRGPDELGLYRDPHAGLVHARLSIIDLASGQQPMASRDGSLWLVFNGEVFNYLELRQELQSQGHTFRTQSDTEVLLVAFEAWGEAAFERMNGQWAVALWNRQAERLVLARDRVGVRPLFVAEHAGSVYFASEVKAIFAAEPSFPRAFDPVGLAQTFTFWASLAPRSVFRGVQEVPPGEAWTLEGGRWKRKAYFGFAFPPEPETVDADIDEATERVRQGLKDATALRMLRSDVPVGSYLSGGLDSSFVAALGRHYAGEMFHTFSLRFEDAEYDETEFQRLMVKQLGSQHHEVVVSRKDIAQVFPDVVFHAERPLLRTAPAPLYLLSRLVRETGIKVVLTGEGADEMFAGYDIFREGKVRRFWAKCPGSTSRPRLLERLYPYLARSPVAQRGMAQAFFGRDLDQAHVPGFAHTPRWRSAAALMRLFAVDMKQESDRVNVVDEFLSTCPAGLRDWSPLAQDQYIEIRTLLSGYLLSSQGDRMLMANSVEGRFPFLDKDVMRLATELPDRFRLWGLDEKHILKRAAVGYVPDSIRRRPKQPYRAPDALAFVAEPMPEYAMDLLDESSLARTGVFDAKSAAMLWKKCRERRADGQFSNSDNMALVGVLSTQLLHHSMVRQVPVHREIGRLRTDVDLSSLGSNDRMPDHA
ncbi:MAG: asparagine synthase (glutamine-hydrolyzing) [Polyangia bacterium]